MSHPARPTTPIPPGTLLTAVYAPRMPANAIPPPCVLQWIGARLEWMAYREPTFGNPHAMAFVLVGGGDAMGLMEGECMYVPPIIAMPGDLRDVRMRGAGTTGKGGVA